MVRVGGMGYRIDINQPQGKRITEMTLLKTGESIDPTQTYVVAGWASVNEGHRRPRDLGCCRRLHQTRRYCVR